MISNMKKTGLLAVLTSGALLLGSCGNSAVKETAMQVGDTTVTLGDIAVMAQMYTSYGYDFETARDMLAEQIEDTLKYGAVGEAMGIELTEEDHDNIIQMKASYAQQGGGLSAYKDYLKKAGSSMDFLDKLFTASAYQSYVTDQMDIAEPTDDELKTYFADNYYRAKHILIENTDTATEEAATEEAATEAADAASTEAAATDASATEAASAEPEKSAEEQANELLERAKSGEDFDSLIAQYSTDPGSESNPDGYIFTDGDMVQEFEDCVKSLQPGEFGICQSDYGYHVIQRLPFSASEPQFEQWFTDNKEAVSSAYETKQREDKLNELCEQNNITVTVNQDVIDGFTEDEVVTPEPTTDDTTTSAG